MKNLFRKMSFWTKLKSFLVLIGVGSEVTLFAMEFSPAWKIVALVATLVSVLITILFEDKDGDGDVDILEKRKQ
jgi:membrane protein YdbS with pleckstrin-like domain